MILCDAEILQAIACGELGFEPSPDMDVQLQPASVDLRLGTHFKVYRTGSPMRVLDTREIHPLTGKLATPDDFMTSIELESGERFVLEPGMFALATTVEAITLPAELVGRVEGRSSWGRMGLMIHSTAGFIDPGFHGNITLELSNLGRYAIALYPGVRICQISLHGMNRPAMRPYAGKYQGQSDVTVSKVQED